MLPATAAKLANFAELNHVTQAALKQYYRVFVPYNS
jgi:hypothetical protein